MHWTAASKALSTIAHSFATKAVLHSNQLIVWSRQALTACDSRNRLLDCMDSKGLERLVSAVSTDLFRTGSLHCDQIQHDSIERYSRGSYNESG